MNSVDKINYEVLNFFVDFNSIYLYICVLKVSVLSIKLFRKSCGHKILLDGKTDLQWTLCDCKLALLTKRNRNGEDIHCIRQIGIFKDVGLQLLPKLGMCDFDNSFHISYLSMCIYIYIFQLLRSQPLAALLLLGIGKGFAPSKHLYFNDFYINF